ncbi:MAG: transporter [Novosphingobium sp.]
MKKTIAMLLAASSALIATTAWADDATGASTSRESEATVATQVAESADTTEFEFATGADYSVGHYGASADTSVWSIPAELKVRSGKFHAQVSVPYVVIDGPGQLVGGVIVNNPGSTTTISRSGIGDVSASAGYLLNRESGALPSFELSGGVKIPTANQTIGTGEIDYSATLSAYKSLSPSTMLFGSVGYSWLTSPAAYSLKNGITASGGINLRPDSGTNLGFSVAYREPVATGLSGQAVVSPYLTHRFGKNLGLTLYGMAGFNDASPRIGAGLRISVFQ